MNIRIVLVRPRNPLNIGAAARAMANFGLTDLMAVKPYPPVWQETISAVGAERIVREARAVKTIQEAIHDCHLVLGTTTTRNRTLQKEVIQLPDLSQYLKKQSIVVGEDPCVLPSHINNKKIAILFGPEKTGLTNKYLNHCHAFLTIPTHPSCPSMNLSHAVAVCCYELKKTEDHRPRTIDQKQKKNIKTDVDMPVTAGQKEQLVQHALKVFEAADYLNFLSPAQRAEKIRRTFLHWNLHSADTALLHGFFRFVLKKV